MKRVLAVLAGLSASIAVIAVIQMIGHMMFSTPASSDMTKEEMAAYVTALPLAAFMSVLLAMALGSLTGGFIAAKIDKKSKKVSPFIIAGVLLIFGIINLIMIPHPMWFMIANLLIYVPFAWMGSKLVKDINN